MFGVFNFEGQCDCQEDGEEERSQGEADGIGVVA
jgi:hypothetical protein